MNQQNKAVLFMLLSSLAFSLMQLFVKWAGPNIPLFEKIFMRNALILVGMLLVMRKNKIPLKIEKGTGWALLARCIAGYLGVICYFYATQHMVLGDASAIHKSSPIFVVVISSLLIGEKFSRNKILPVLIGFIGVMLIVKPSFDSSVLPAMVALLGALGAALAYTIISYIGPRIASEVIILAFAAFSTIASIPFFINQFVVPQGTELFALLGIGLFGGLGQFFVTYAYKLAKPGDISIYSYSSIIFSSMMGAMFFKEHPDMLSYLGVAIILMTGYWLFEVTRRERRAALKS